MGYSYPTHHTPTYIHENRGNHKSSQLVEAFIFQRICAIYCFFLQFPAGLLSKLLVKTKHERSIVSLSQYQCCPLPDSTLMILPLGSPRSR